MNVSLTPELQELVDKKVASGLYHTASEVIREGLRLLAEQDRMRQARFDALQRELNVGVSQLNNGEGIPLDENLVSKIQQRARARLDKQRP